MIKYYEKYRKEKFSTIRVEISDLITDRKKHQVDMWLQAGTDIVNIFLSSIKSNNTTDYAFLHEINYKKCREKYPYILSSSIQHLRDYAIDRAEGDESFRFSNNIAKSAPFFIDKKAFNIQKDNTGKFFDLWVNIGSLSLPVQGKHFSNTLKKYGIFQSLLKSHEKFNKDAELQQLTELSEKELRNAEFYKNGNQEKVLPNRVIKNRVIRPKYNAQGFRVVKALLLRKRGKLYFHIVVASKRTEIDKSIVPRQRIVREVQSDQPLMFSKEKSRGMGQALKTFLDTSRTVFKKVFVDFRARKDEQVPNEVSVLSVPSWESTNNDEVKSQVDSHRRQWAKRVVKKRWKEFIGDGGYNRIHDFNKRFLTPFGLEPIVFTKIIYQQ